MKNIENKQMNNSGKTDTQRTPGGIGERADSKRGATYIAPSSTCSQMIHFPIDGVLLPSVSNKLFIKCFK